MRLNNATMKQVIVSPATLGERLRLCSIRPYFEYIDGKRSDTILGYTYTVTCSGFAGERMDIKIPGKKLLGDDAYDRLAKFSNLRIGIYPSYVREQRGIFVFVAAQIPHCPPLSSVTDVRPSKSHKMHKGAF